MALIKLRIKAIVLSGVRATIAPFLKVPAEEEAGSNPV